MSLKHTPGPWHRNIPPARKYCTVFAGRNTHVADVLDPAGMSDEEIEANCNLIAAAPDLAAACQPALSKTSIEHLKQLAEAIEATSSRKTAASLVMLLEWHERARAAYLKIGGADA